MNSFGLFEKTSFVMPREREDLAQQVLIPSFKGAEAVDLMFGYFSSAALKAIAPGVASYINKSDKTRIRMVVSPFLTSEDVEYIRKGYEISDELAQKLFPLGHDLEDALINHTLECLAYLIKQDRLEIKIAIRDGEFHVKAWIFWKGSDQVVVDGSANFSHRAFYKNSEHIGINSTIDGSGDSQRIANLTKMFDSHWNDQEEDCVIIPAPEAIKNNLVRNFSGDKPPEEKDYFDLARSLYSPNSAVSEDSDLYSPNMKEDFSFPSWLEYKTGPFKHQGEAVKAWVDAGYRGILEMATGSGKTITSLICAHEVFSKYKPLLIVVAAPYRPLMEQWIGEIALFGLTAENISQLRGAKERGKYLAKINRRLSTGVRNVEIMVVSHTTLCNPEFASGLGRIQCKKLLIADEAHNLGAEGFISSPPDFFEYRLALSATPVRQYDEDGTRELFNFFGEPVFVFSLKDAIGFCLVEYDYYVHPVELTASEMEEWYTLTNQIKSMHWNRDDPDTEERLQRLFRKRRLLLETAEGKIPLLEQLLTKGDKDQLRHTLIYGTAKDPQQLEEINSLLHKQGLLYHQLTAKETGDSKLVSSLINSFRAGQIQVLTAKKVLDEGVNIPEISKAFILASSTVEREWVQRRGRLLRKCSAIDKGKSIIHDFISLPPLENEALDEDAKKLVESELRRIKEFAQLARNAGAKDGPLSLIRELVQELYY